MREDFGRYIYSIKNNTPIFELLIGLNLVALLIILLMFVYVVSENMFTTGTLLNMVESLYLGLLAFGKSLIILGFTDILVLALVVISFFIYKGMCLFCNL